MHNINTIIAFFFFIYVFLNNALQPYTLVWPIHQGLKYPTMRCEKSEHFHKCGTPNL